MKKLFASCVLAGILGLSLLPTTTRHTSAQSVGATSTPAATATPAPTPTPAPPFPGSKSPILISVDTVQGAGGSPAPAVGCSLTNLFRQGQVVVFRLWGMNARLGGAILTPKNVTSVQVIIPGLTAPISFAFGNHGTVAFWSAPWRTNASTPLGLVDYTVVVKTKAVKFQGKKVKSFTARYTQQGLALPSRLTITP